MNLPPKIERWRQSQYCPQRCLISGSQNGLSVALTIAAYLNNEPVEKIESGIESDVLLLKDEGERFKIGDDQNPDQNSARGLIKWVSQKPIKPKRIVILENFERASREAPQTLLKVLEEPPAQAVFLFTTKNHHQILPTILSRMTVVPLTTVPQDLPLNSEAEVFFRPGNLATKLKYIEQLEKIIKKEGSKKPLTDFVEALLNHARLAEGAQTHLEKIFQAQEDLSRNINHRLVLEQLALRLSM